MGGHLKRINDALLIFSILTLSACGFAPGMHLSESGWKDGRVDVTPITGELLASQLLEQARSYPVSKDGSKLRKQLDTYQYRVGPHDVLQITVWDHPELTTPAGQFRDSAETGNLVRSDGTIFYPFVGVINVSGRSVEGIRIMLTSRLEKYIRSPQVDVRVAVYRSKKMYVTGEVARPGVLPITDTPLTILDAINQSGGIKSAINIGQEYEADLQNVILSRAGREYRIDVLSLYKQGNLSQNYLLQNGDSLHVPDNNFNKVFVLGEVKNPRSLRIHHGRITLAEAIGDVQGFDLSFANTGRVYVIRGIIPANGKSGTEMPWQQNPATLKQAAIYRLDASSADALILADQFKLQPRDVVYVATHPVADWGRTLSHLSTTIQAVAIGIAATK